MRILKFRSQPTIAFSLLSIIVTDLLGNKTLLHGFKRSWFVICGFRSVLCVSLFQGSLLVIVNMIDGSDKLWQAKHDKSGMSFKSSIEFQ